MLMFGITLTACDSFLVVNKITPETINHISTVVMSANIKVSTKVYKKDVFPKPEGTYKYFGSGVIIKEEEYDLDRFYYFLTNYHVIMFEGDYDYLYEVEDIYGNIYHGELVAYSKESDLALLKFVSEIELYVVDLASRNQGINDLVFSVGSPKGKNNIITAGKIIGYKTIEEVNYDVIVHEAYIEKGSSGGMLINIDYELVGLNAWGFKDSTVSESEGSSGTQPDAPVYLRGGAIPIEIIIYFFNTNNFQIK